MKTLVVLLSETRGWELTWEPFCANVLDSLDADLAICGRAGEDPNPLYDRARYVWTAEESGDWAAEYDRLVGSSEWKGLLSVNPLFLGGIEDSRYPQVGSGAIQWFYRRLLAESVDAACLIDEYDWLVVSRSDLMWPLPHAPVRHLSKRHLHFLDGEQYGGVTDRHAIVPRRHASAYLHLADVVFDDPVGLKHRIDRFLAADGWSLFNPERFLAFRLLELGLWDRVRYLPYLPYAIRAEGGRTKWSTGVLDEELGHYIKYPSEKERSDISARFITDERSWKRFLSPLRGRAQRRELTEAYRDRGLYERRFNRQSGSARIRSELRLLPARAGRILRRVPLFAPVLDARLAWMQRRAQRRDRLSDDHGA